LIFYADTSFLVSLYVSDAHTQQAASHLKKLTPPIPLTPLGEMELVNAISLGLFRKELPPREARMALSAMRKDIEVGVLRLTPLPYGVFEKGKQLASKRTPVIGTRTLDVLHVSSALALNAEMFLTFDVRQGELAKEEGLKVP
jgi:predicted nucleic acid-binding protein